MMVANGGKKLVIIAYQIKIPSHEGHYFLGMGHQHAFHRVIPVGIELDDYSFDIHRLIPS